MVDVIYLNIRKAFNAVSYSIMASKSGINGPDE